MAFSIENKLVIGVSSRALFDLEDENRVYETEGLAAYSELQISKENEVLKPGTAFPLIKALTSLTLDGEPLTEVIIMSRNSANTSLRIFNSIEYYGLNIKRAALAGGSDISRYLDAFHTDLFLSANGEDVEAAINSGFAAGIICKKPDRTDDPFTKKDTIRIAFDGDAVIFSDEAEKIYKERGLEAFTEHEHLNAMDPLPEGPFARFLATVSLIQNRFAPSESPIRTALVTARNAPAHERVIRTLRAWNVRIDEAFFLGGLAKSDVLKAFDADIFFDDQSVHTDPASHVVPSAKVPYKTK